MITLYLSSTCEDLKEYREVVYKALRQSGHDVIAMEDYVAADQRPVDKCLADITSVDIYVGIFAFRYGYVPPDSHGNPKKLSITELEFRQAVSLAKPCLTFVVNESTPWRASFMNSQRKTRASASIHSGSICSPRRWQARFPPPMNSPRLCSRPLQNSRQQRQKPSKSKSKMEQ